MESLRVIGVSDKDFTVELLSLYNFPRAMMGNGSIEVLIYRGVGLSSRRRCLAVFFLFIGPPKFLVHFFYRTQQSNNC